MRWFILVVLFSSSAQAEIFKCVNSAGKKTYQQSPCEENTSVEGYKFREESAATKASRQLSRKKIAEKKKADAIAKRNREIAESNDRIRRSNERTAEARASFGEAKARSANNIADYNKAASDRVKIKNNYLEKTLNAR